MASKPISREIDLATYALDALRCEGSERILHCMREGNWSDLIASFDACDPRSYSNAEVFRDDWFAFNLLRKADFLPLAIDRKRVAKDKFQVAERLCAASNIRLLTPYAGPTCIGGPSVESVISTARQKIQRLLGRFRLRNIVPFVGFSSGASFSLPRTKGDPFYKCQQMLESTPRCRRYAKVFISMHPLWKQSLIQQYGSLESAVKTVAGNALETVPKDAKTDRMIAKEPSMNMYVQRGIGGLIRRRLRKVGVNLNDQSLNQRLAREGSVDGKLATVDLSAASDSISLELVRLLIPHDWFSVMDRTRSHWYKLDEKWKRYSKISSMGNGFTFELESLIFWAISESVRDLLGCQDSRLAIYGDDIIVPVECVPLLKETLSYLGFELNMDKSFWSGHFRESCGKHYFSGVDVTPVYIRKRLSTKVRKFWYANSLRRWSTNMYDGMSIDDRMGYAWSAVVMTLPVKWRKPRLPDGVGDGALIGSFAESSPSYSLARGAFMAHHLVGVDLSIDADGWPGLFRYFHSTGAHGDPGREQSLTDYEHVRKIECQPIFMERWADIPCWGSSL